MGQGFSPTVAGMARAEILCLFACLFPYGVGGMESINPFTSYRQLNCPPGRWCADPSRLDFHPTPPAWNLAQQRLTSDKLQRPAWAWLAIRWGETGFHTYLGRYLGHSGRALVMGQAFPLRWGGMVRSNGIN